MASRNVQTLAGRSLGTTSQDVEVLGTLKIDGHTWTVETKDERGYRVSPARQRRAPKAASRKKSFEYVWSPAGMIRVERNLR